MAMTIFNKFVTCQVSADTVLKCVMSFKQGTQKQRKGR